MTPQNLDGCFPTHGLSPANLDANPSVTFDEIRTEKHKDRKLNWCHYAEEIIKKVPHKFFDLLQIYIRKIRIVTYYSYYFCDVNVSITSGGGGILSKPSQIIRGGGAWPPEVFNTVLSVKAVIPKYHDHVKEKEVKCLGFTSKYIPDDILGMSPLSCRRWRLWIVCLVNR